MLSARTHTETSHATLRALELRFKTWEQLRDASLEAVTGTIVAVTFPDNKAYHLQHALRRITRQNAGRLNLDFFEGQPTDRIRRWLESFPGIGPKTSAAIVNSSTLRRIAITIDSHHHRIALRLHLVPPGTSVAETEQRLLAMAPASWPAEQLDEHHSLVKLHGQRCPLLPICPTGEKIVAGRQF